MKTITDDAERFLFPFEYVPKGSRVLIYGAGLVGQRYLQQVMATNYCHVIGFADRNYAEFNNLAVTVYAPNEIHTLDFDYVVIALRNSIPLHAVREFLLEEGVAEEQIIFVGARVYPAVWLKNSEDRELSGKLAFSQQSNACAFSLSGGFGDMIIQKRFLSEFIRLAPDCKIDIFCVNDVPFMEWLYSDCKEHISNIILNRGTYYERYNGNYAFGMTLDGSGYWAVDVFKPEMFSEREAVLQKKIHALTNFGRAENMQPSVLFHTVISRCTCKGLSCYTRFGFDGIFDIHDDRVVIPLESDIEGELLLHNMSPYITINCGVGNSSDGRGVAKAWTKERFQQVIELLHSRYTSVKVVQVGGGNAVRMSGADSYWLGKSFESVACLLKHAILHIDVEGGLVHLATQLGTKCAVLFGPTQVAYFGYSQNINIKTGKCHDCYGLYDNLDRCARGMEKPECMYKITPEYVMEKIIPYLDEVLVK